MPRFHNINGNRVQFTAEEETARDAEEQAHADGALARDIEKLRTIRTARLRQTDWYASTDITMSSDMTTYRQALRDLPEGLSTVEDVANVTWPTKPS